MSVLNPYFSTSNASSYVEQLFGKSSRASAWESTEPTSRRQGYTEPPGPTARDRAIDTIITLIWNMQNGGGTDETSVNAQGGYILDATGTDGADKIDMKAISVFNLSTAAGDDTVTVKAGSIAALDAGDGNDTVNLSASYIADIAGGDGDDVIQLAARFADGISGGQGNDTIKISADTMLGISGGDGDDTLYLEGKRIFAAGGTGNDTITINNLGDKPATLSFARGDGKDVVNTNGPLDMRFGYPSLFGVDTGFTAPASPLTPEDLDISASGNTLILRSTISDDMITIHFDAGALEKATPQFKFELDQGTYVLKIR